MKRNLTQPSFFAIMQALNLLTLRVSPLDPLRAPNNVANRRAAATKPVFFLSASAGVETSASVPNRTSNKSDSKSFSSSILAGPKVSAPQRQKDPKKCVVITGMRFVFVFDNDIEGYYENLLAGESGITTINRFDASRFPNCFGGQIRGFSPEGYIDNKNDRRLDDSLRYCIGNSRFILGVFKEVFGRESSFVKYSEEVFILHEVFGGGVHPL
ncbi:hypothetical protein LR48_Vigan252s000400 [Vigna angularis]|uniref:beta-ketoacyl-[acyl-carrier-protein] synthase I n=1 Tax=Phaseolus angularis TaxID=3914 RepID=A0A0L9T6T2_PHAAN|nr:hypothetical protein LR48_Vigan252s000400 [Vigna angularis]